MNEIVLKCVSCQYEWPIEQQYDCPACGGILEVCYKLEESRCKEFTPLLPLDKQELISLGEGNTSLIPSQRLAKKIGLKHLSFKCEFMNPTGSFKDRPVAIGISMAKKFGYKRVIVASSGNGAGSVSAYAARAGMEAVILVPESTPIEKVRQSQFYGASVIKVPGPYSHCFSLAKEIGEKLQMCNLTTTFLNPYTVEGDKTVAYELIDQLEGKIPDIIFIPIGAGPLLAGIYKGYEEYNYFQPTKKMPRMAGIQAEGCNPIARAFLEERKEVQSVARPHTLAGGIGDGLDGYAKDGTHTLTLIRQSKGFSLAVTDEEILQAQSWLAQYEGLFVEPSAAAALAGLITSVKEGRMKRTDQAVVVLTGHGLKDMSCLKAKEPPVISTVDEVGTFLKREEDKEWQDSVSPK